MAGLQATHYHVDRTAERLTMARPSTLRGADGKPIDATIDNLSVTGCQLTVPAWADIHTDVVVGLAGVGIRSARVIWSEADHIGCAFHTPLTLAELQQAQFPQTVEEGRFPALPALPEHGTIEVPAKFDYAVTGLVIAVGGLAIAAWALIGGVATAGYLLLAN